MHPASGFAVIAVLSGPGNEPGSAFTPDNYKSYLITFPRLCFPGEFLSALQSARQLSSVTALITF